MTSVLLRVGYLNIYLTGGLMRGSLTRLLLRLYYVQSLQHHGIESHAR
jgi:hypothetical protein